MATNWSDTSCVKPNARIILLSSFLPLLFRGFFWLSGHAVNACEALLSIEISIILRISFTKFIAQITRSILDLWMKCLWSNCDHRFELIMDGICQKPSFIFKWRSKVENTAKGQRSKLSVACSACSVHSNDETNRNLLTRIERHNSCCHINAATTGATGIAMMMQQIIMSCWIAN